MEGLATFWDQGRKAARINGLHGFDEGVFDLIGEAGQCRFRFIAGKGDLTTGHFEEPASLMRKRAGSTRPSSSH